LIASFTARRISMSSKPKNTDGQPPANPLSPSRLPVKINRRNFLVGTSAISASLIVDAAFTASPPPGLRNKSLKIENPFCRIELDAKTGGLRRIVNRRLGDDCLKDGRSEMMPFRIFADLTREFEISQNAIFQLAFQPPESISKTLIQPGNCRITHVNQTNGLQLFYEVDGFRIALRIQFAGETGVSDWFLQITNIGEASRDFLVCWPCLDGLQPGFDPRFNLATAMIQAGMVVPAWEKPGGVFGESNQMSMQWHAIWNSATKSALGLIFMDPDARPKRLSLAEPTLEMHYFPPVKLAPGASIDLPPTRMIVYEGDWRPAARAYHAWFSGAYASVQAPEWFRKSNGLIGRHFKKKVADSEPDRGGLFALNSFRELPRVHLRVPVDNTEYAFFTRGSVNPKVHTDGDNFVRDDLGGAAAMREGIAGVHRLGLHTTLYIEGFIVWEGSELGQTGKAERWAIMHKNGSRIGPYSDQGFYHLCPGCVEWQDHLVEVAARLLRETDADGIRLDSLGFYYLPCYNPAHRHETPFGYNDWIKQLLSKVRAAALAVNPDVLLTTEGPSDWFSPWFHGALTSPCPRELPLMRLAVGPYRPYVYSACSAIWASLSGLPGGGCGGSDLTPLDGNWLCARFPVHEALVWGSVPEGIPRVSDPQSVARLFKGVGYWALVVVRSNCDDPFKWPWDLRLHDTHVAHTVELPGLGTEVDEAILCDVENLTWSVMKSDLNGNNLLLHLRTNWALVILRSVNGPGLVGFDELPALSPGNSTTVRLHAHSTPPTAIPVSIEAPGLVVTPSSVTDSGEFVLAVPENTLPGNYGVTVAGNNLLGFKRILKVI
jgi:hypothetical protein